MIETFKLITEKENIDESQFFTMATNDHGLKEHSMKFFKKHSRLDKRKNFYGRRVVNE